MNIIMCVQKTLLPFLTTLFISRCKSTTSDKWVSYEDSFGAERNYNGSYPHEGCDIMAENNVSGYYPIVSVSDGIVENIGWLEKGGYRVGIRSSQGAIFIMLI